MTLSRIRLIRYRNDIRQLRPEHRKTCEISRIHKPAQIADARLPGNPCQGESPHDYRTEKRTSAHG
jgi:hypothetical protein